MLFINGEWRDAASGATFESHNPATGEVIGTAADAGVADVQAAVVAADAAFEGWSTRTAYERSAFLVQAHQLMLERREALAKLMTEEQGKPIRMARNEVGYAADFLLWFAEEAKRVYGETIPSARADQRFLVLRQPVGVVARDHPVELPGVDAHPQDRARRWPRAARSCSSRRSRHRCSRSRRSSCSRRSGCPRAS